VPEIRLKKLRKEFREVVAVKDVTITFPPSSVTCLLGPSGCGKTTLLRMIAGLEKPTAGDVYFDDKRVTDLAPEKRNIGMVFQYPVVYRGLNVYRNIDLPLIENRLSEEERKERIMEVSEILDLKESLEKDISQLDNSTRQKVAVARAVARKPHIILFDEPLTNVDVNTKVQMKQALKRLTRQLKQTIVYVTHDQTEAMTLADQIALMNEGVIVQQASPRELYNHPSNVFGGWFLGNPGMNFLRAEVEKSGYEHRLKCPFLPETIIVEGLTLEKEVILGVRPENILLHLKETQGSVSCEIMVKSIVVGGQYLISVKVDDSILKAKIDSSIGRKLENKAWVKIPLEHITIFRKDGERIKARIKL